MKMFRCLSELAARIPRRPIILRLEIRMQTQADAIAAIAALKVSVDALVAAKTTPAQTDFQPIVDAVTGIKTEVDSALAAPVEQPSA